MTRVEHLVARTRFELVISALRGRRPEPLDERAVYGARLRRKDITGTGTGAQGGFVRKSNLWMTCGGALDRSGLARGPADRDRGAGSRLGWTCAWVPGRDGHASGSPDGTDLRVGCRTGRVGRAGGHIVPDHGGCARARVSSLRAPHGLTQPLCISYAWPAGAGPRFGQPYNRTSNATRRTPGVFPYRGDP